MKIIGTKEEIAWIADMCVEDAITTFFKDGREVDLDWNKCEPFCDKEDCIGCFKAFGIELVEE